jgi:hypothetical protein
MKLLEAQTTIAAGASMTVRRDYRDLPRRVKVAITGTASVSLQGRMDPNDSWLDLGEAFTGTSAQSIQLMPEVRFNVTAVDGSVDAWVDAL